MMKKKKIDGSIKNVEFRDFFRLHYYEYEKEEKSQLCYLMKIDLEFANFFSPWHFDDECGCVEVF
jgi:hypothetical protein